MSYLGNWVLLEAWKHVLRLQCFANTIKKSWNRLLHLCYACSLGGNHPPIPCYFIYLFVVWLFFFQTHILPGQAWLRRGACVNPRPPGPSAGATVEESSPCALPTGGPDGRGGRGPPAQSRCRGAPRSTRRRGWGWGWRWGPRPPWRRWRGRPAGGSLAAGRKCTTTTINNNNNKLFDLWSAFHLGDLSEPSRAKTENC